MERYVAFDIGDKRIGVAVSDPFNTYALPSFTYHRKGFKEDIAALVDIAKEKGATKIVCGLPVNFDGTSALQTEKTERFISALEEAASVPVIREDERFTTVMAHETLIEEGMKRKERKSYVDALAAANILDGYLQKINEKGKNAMADEKNDVSEEEEEDEIIELVDEDNNVIRFRMVDVTEYKGKKYALLMPAEENSAVADDEVAIFLFNEKEQTLETIEDENLLEEIFEFYQSEEDGEE